MITGLVPVKALRSSKSRLLPHLGREAVGKLAIAMMGDVVDALLSVPALERVAVVTPDDEVARAAREFGAEPLLRQFPGLNAALDGSASELARNPTDGVLVVLGDVAGVSSTDIETLLGSLRGRGVALAPSSDGGTSALLRIPFDIMPARFGPNSAAAHRKEAAAHGAHFVEVPLESLALDIDERADIDTFLAQAGLGERTRDVLGSLL